MTWHGTLSRTLEGVMHAAGESWPIKATGTVGAPLTIRVATPNGHWEGAINPERTRWRLGCAFGFRFAGPVSFDKGVIVLGEHDYCRIPDELRLPGDPEPVAEAA